MSKLLVVFGATGQQGGSVIDCVLNDAVLSQQYTLRGITRSRSSPAAQKLAARGVEILEADMDNEASLERAVQGSHTVFCVTVTSYTADLEERETRQGRAMIDAVVRSGAQYLIFSTLSSPKEISSGSIVVESFDLKWELEQYIRSLPIKSAFFAPGCFMENFAGMLGPQAANDGSGDFVMVNVIAPDTKLPLIATALDSGKYVAAILAEPEKFEGKILSASTEMRSISEIARAISNSTGKTVKSVQIPESELQTYMSASQGDLQIRMMRYIERYGYFGPDTEGLVDWTKQQARGKLTTFEEYLKLTPLTLE